VGTVEEAERAKWSSVRARTQGVGAVVHCVGRHVQRVRGLWHRVWARTARGVGSNDGRAASLGVGCVSGREAWRCDGSRVAHRRTAVVS